MKGLPAMAGLLLVPRIGTMACPAAGSRESRPSRQVRAVGERAARPATAWSPLYPQHTGRELMKHRLPIAVLLFCLASSRAARAGDASSAASPSAAHPDPVLDARLTVGETVISYPRGLEFQAQQVAEVCKAIMGCARRQNQ